LSSGNYSLAEDDPVVSLDEEALAEGWRRWNASMLPAAFHDLDELRVGLPERRVRFLRRHFQRSERRPFEFIRIAQAPPRRRLPARRR
jgi:hypothetical protein